MCRQHQGKYEAEHSDAVIEQIVRPTGLLDPELEVRPVDTQVDDLLSEIQLRVEKQRTSVGDNIN